MSETLVPTSCGIIRIDLLKITLHYSFLRKSDMWLTNAKSFKHSLPSCTTLLLVLAWLGVLSLLFLSSKCSLDKSFDNWRVWECHVQQLQIVRKKSRGVNLHSCTDHGSVIFVLVSWNPDLFKKRLYWDECFKVLIEGALKHKQSLLWWNIALVYIFTYLFYSHLN